MKFLLSSHFFMFVMNNSNPNIIRKGKIWWTQISCWNHNKKSKKKQTKDQMKQACFLYVRYNQNYTPKHMRARSFHLMRMEKLLVNDWARKKIRCPWCVAIGITYGENVSNEPFAKVFLLSLWVAAITVELKVLLLERWELMKLLTDFDTHQK